MTNKNWSAVTVERAFSWGERAGRFLVIKHQAASILDAIECRARMRKTKGSMYLNQDERIVLHHLSPGYVHGTSRTHYERTRMLHLVDLARQELVNRVTDKLTNH